MGSDNFFLGTVLYRWCIEWLPGRKKLRLAVDRIWYHLTNSHLINFRFTNSHLTNSQLTNSHLPTVPFDQFSLDRHWLNAYACSYSEINIIKDWSPVKCPIALTYSVNEHSPFSSISLSRWSMWMQTGRARPPASSCAILTSTDACSHLNNSVTSKMFG